MSISTAVILGSPRSGTTFLMHVLNGLPDSECMVGTLLPVAIPHVVNQDIPRDVYEALAVGFERSLDAYLHSARFYSRGAALQKWGAAPTGLRGLIDAFKGNRKGIQRLIYKEPFLSLAPDFTYQALPEARIIHIYRDGRDVANSLVRSYDVLSNERLTNLLGSEMRLGRSYDGVHYVPWWVEAGKDDEFMAGSPYVRAIWMWKYMVRRCHDFFSRPEIEQSGRVMLLRYEDLMRQPEKYGKAVLDHLGAKPSKHFWKRLRSAHADSIGKYRKRDKAEVEAAERIAGEELRLYGYTLSSSTAETVSA
jgi:hypothetical protein